MSEDVFKEELEGTGLEITPSALEVFKNSYIAPNELIKALINIKNEKQKVITVRKAIDIILEINEHKYKERRLISELKLKTELKKLPKPLQRTLKALIKLNRPSLPGDISRITHRRKKTEKRYLTMLSDLGFVQQIEKEQKVYFMFNTRDS
ncbi:MAG: hypothetical protein ACTSPV_12935 [Candidatus Hodarchaeales archaeon]